MGDKFQGTGIDWNSVFCIAVEEGVCWGRCDPSFPDLVPFTLRLVVMDSVSHQSS